MSFSNKKFLLWRIVYRCRSRILLQSFWSCWRGWGLQTRRRGGGISSVHTTLWTHPGSGVDPALSGSPGEETQVFTCVRENNTSPGGILTSLCWIYNFMTSNSKIVLTTAVLPVCLTVMLGSNLLLCYNQNIHHSMTKLCARQYYLHHSPE